MKQFLLLEKAKDETIIFKVPGAMKEKLIMDSKRFGIDSSKLLRYILAAFLTLPPTDQISFIKSIGKQKQGVKKSIKSKRNGQRPEIKNREVE